MGSFKTDQGNQMTTKKMLKNALAIILIVASLAFSSYAEPVFNSVNFTNPLGIGLQQTVYAEISSSNPLLSVNIEIENINNSMILNNGKYEYSWAPSAGTINFKVYAIDNQTLVSTYLSSFMVKDLVAPIITIITPSGIVTSDATELKISTDEESSCKFDTSNRTYSQMSSFFTSTGGVLHKSLLVHIPAGKKDYFVACRDINGNIAYGYLNFDVNLGPTAQITLARPSPLKSDTYKINVLTSKPLTGSPIIQYKFDDEQKYYQISLIGQDSNWEGYLVISAESKDRIGTFSFQGLDYDGITGTKITSGALFIVDTIKPIAPVSLDARVKDDKVEISWFYNGEDPDGFNIYRSTLAGVEYTDYYDDDSKTPFLDTGVDNQQDYYYRVAAVDKAGNIGDLSSEVHILFEEDVKETGSVQTIVISEKLSASLEKRLNTTYNEAKTLKFDIKFALSQIEKQTDRFKALTINELKIIENANSAELSTDTVLQELDNLRSQNLNEASFEEKITSIQDKLEKIKEDVISEIVIIDSLEFTQSASEAELGAAINEVFLRKEIEEGTKSNYSKTAASLQDTSTIFGTIIVAKLKSLNGIEKYVTLLTKEVSTSQVMYNIILLESIPKTFSESSKNIIFSQNPVVLKDDPLVYWTYPKLENVKFSYYIYKKLQISDVKDARTIIMPDPVKSIPKKGVYGNDTALETPKTNILTGNFVLEAKSSLKNYKEYIFIGLGILIISGLLIYYFFFINDSGIDNDEYANVLGKKQDFNLENENSQLPIRDTGSAIIGRDEKHFLSLIEHAEMHANNLNLDQAAKEYALIYSFFNSTMLNPKFKSKVTTRIGLLHKRINVKRKIEFASDAAIKGDLELLKKILEEIKSTKESFLQSEKHPLKDYVQEYFDYYSLIMNKSDKKNEGK